MSCVPDSTCVVYLIDDDPGISTALSLFLTHRGVRVLGFSSAERFLSAYKPLPHLCVVTDVRLPDMTGFEALDALAEQGHQPPAIVISGHGPPPVHFHTRQTDVAGVLLKPFEPDELLALIKATAACV